MLQRLIEAVAQNQKEVTTEAPCTSCVTRRPTRLRATANGAPRCYSCGYAAALESLHLPVSVQAPAETLRDSALASFPALA